MKSQPRTYHHDSDADRRLQNRGRPRAYPPGCAGSGEHGRRMRSIEAGGSRDAGLGRRRERLRPHIGPLLAAVSAPHPLLWLAAVLICAVDAVWLAAAGIALDPAAPLALAALVALLLAASAGLGAVKSEPTLRGMALASAALVAFTVPTAVLHYLAATLARPLIDADLARAESALGFDWPAWLAVLEAHPHLNRWLSLAYHSSGPQVALVVIVLAATRRLGRLWTYVRLFCASLLCVVAVSAVLPAAGAYSHYAPGTMPGGAIETVGALWHLDALARLRAGTLDTLHLGAIRGLVTFPSFHVCLAVLTAWALAPVPRVGPLALGLNAAVVVATIGSGGHYLPDLLTGGAVAAAALALRRGRVARPWGGAASMPPPRFAGPSGTGPATLGCIRDIPDREMPAG